MALIPPPNVPTCGDCCRGAGGGPITLAFDCLSENCGDNLDTCCKNCRKTSCNCLSNLNKCCKKCRKKPCNCCKNCIKTSKKTEQLLPFNPLETMYRIKKYAKRKSVKKSVKKLKNKSKNKSKKKSVRKNKL